MTVLYTNEAIMSIAAGTFPQFVMNITIALRKWISYVANGVSMIE
jgi:hypothetical protein